MPAHDVSGAAADGDSSSSRDREELLRIVRERGHVRHEEPFRLSSGGLSHDYVDLRAATARGPDLATAARVVLGRMEELGIGFDAIGGMTMGADPVAHAAALLSGKEWFSVRKAAKDHGSQRRIEGAPIGEGWRVLLFEDTVSTGGSIIAAAEVVLATGAEIVVACTLLDRGAGAGERLAALGIDYQPLLDHEDLGIEALAAGRQ
jgi:orotate phosphoribosyltransferase